MKTFTENKKAHFDYEFLEKFEAGLVLTGQEAKSIRLGRMKIIGSYVILRGNEAYLINSNIPPYQTKNTPESYNSSRARKLLLNKSEIRYLIGKSQQEHLTLVPLRVYTKKEKIKLEFALAKGRKKADKKNLIKKRETDREIKRELKIRG
ncbi:MAG: SsrA-binding protein SmpB [Candidatus Nealsonbacteria bacterium]|nr:SsrA-binding protein SmpB [Candidatus Nealsonbacteria bacterium]